MSCARPSLITSSPGLVGQIIHLDTGWVSEPSEEAMAAGLKAMLISPDLCQRLGGAARRHIVNTMSFDVVFEREFSIISELYRTTVKNALA